MKPATLILDLVLLCYISTAAVVSAPKEHFRFKGLDGKYSDYEIVKPEIVGLVNGVEFAFNGTIQEYIAAGKKFDPAFDIELVEEVATRNAKTNLEKRQTITGRICIPVPGQPWYKAHFSFFHDGSEYLRNKNTRINQPGKSCGRISCSYNAAIWMCNDKTTSHNPHTTSLANMADDIMGTCRTSASTGGDLTGGQIFDHSGINLILRNDDTNGC